MKRYPTLTIEQELNSTNMPKEIAAVNKEIAAILGRIHKLETANLKTTDLNEEQQKSLDEARKNLRQYQKDIKELSPSLLGKQSSDDNTKALKELQQNLSELKKSIDEKFPSLEADEDDDDEMKRKPYKGHAEVTGDTSVDDPIKTFFAQLREILSKLPALIRGFLEYQSNLAADRHNKTIDKIEALGKLRPEVGQHLAEMSGANKDGKKVYDYIKNDIEKNKGQLTTLLVSHEGLAEALKDASTEEKKTFTHLAKAMYANKDFLALAAKDPDEANKIIDKMIGKNIKNPDFKPTSKDAKGTIQGLLIDNKLPKTSTTLLYDATTKADLPLQQIANQHRGRPESPTPYSSTTTSTNEPPTRTELKKKLPGK